MVINCGRIDRQRVFDARRQADEIGRQRAVAAVSVGSPAWAAAPGQPWPRSPSAALPAAPFCTGKQFFGCFLAGFVGDPGCCGGTGASVHLEHEVGVLAVGRLIGFCKYLGFSSLIARRNPLVYITLPLPGCAPIVFVRHQLVRELENPSLERKEQ